MTAVSAVMRAEIESRLRSLEAEENIRILLAVESGSRAWGFWSPDSDYDVRFIYVRPVDWHLSVYPGRDVVERPISDELDLSGWDLRKTLGLMLGSNAVVMEWVQSPIRYVSDPAFQVELLDFGRMALRRKPVMYHYHRLATRQREGLLAPDGTAKLKRYFYTMRPVLALRWMRIHDRAAVPPMDMATLLEQAEPPAEARAEIEALIEKKRSVKEIGTTRTTPPAIDRLIETELAAAEKILGRSRPEPKPQLEQFADSLHIRWTRRAEEPR